VGFGNLRADGPLRGMGCIYRGEIGDSEQDIGGRIGQIPRWIPAVRTRFCQLDIARYWANQYPTISHLVLPIKVYTESEVFSSSIVFFRLFLMVREVSCPRRRPHSGPIEQ